ncbi:MAG: N-acetylneuraminate synthase family protein [Lentisphaerae bacterium]|nr:N-acetylneuraminate synthase family protein [Lentisphaerota bacterium]
METLTLEGRLVGPGRPAFLIAEVAQAHDGSLGMAHAYVDAAADAGADAVKFQTHLARWESTYDEPFRVPFSRQDATRYDYWRRMEFGEDQWRGLMEHARERGLVFLSSVFCPEGVALLERLGVAAWKLPAGEYRSAALIDAMAATGKPVLVSTGMSTWADIAFAAERVRAAGAPLALMQATSRYPARLEDVGLNVLDALRAEYDCPVGLSDHSGSPYPGLAALARGADALEVHVVFDRRQFGPDVSASLTFEELRLLAGGRDAFAVLDAHPVDKDAMAAGLDAMRAAFSKSLAPKEPLPAGTVLTADMLTGKKPGTGIPESEAGRLAGRKLLRDVVPERLLRREDVEDGPDGPGGGDA